MKMSIGNPVTAEDFFDREAEQRAMWRRLERDHILLLAPRRIGKTSLMHRLCDTALSHHFQAAICSFAPCNTELECVQTLYKAVTDEQRIDQKVKNTLIEMLKKIQGIDVAGVGIQWGGQDKDPWRQIGDAIATALRQTDRTWLICVDEVPVFILKLLEQEDGRAKARSFLYWFRDLRQTHHKQVRWILAGSIGMDTVASRLGLSDTINDLATMPLGAFDTETAHRFLTKLGNSYHIPLDEALRHHIIQRIGWPVPYYLQLMFSQLRDIRDTKAQLTIADVDHAFENLLSPSYKVHFDYWHQRLREELNHPDAGYATHLLNHTCRDPNGVSHDTLKQALAEKIADAERREESLRYLLDVLENDGYLVNDSGRYRFRLAWLREYWLRRIAP